MQARVYKNLNNGKWSIKQRIDGKWQVIGHADHVELLDATPYVSAARHAHVRKGNHREVFAWLVGSLQRVEGFEAYKGRRPVFTGFASDCFPVATGQRVTFHPFADDERGFHFAGVGTPFVGASAVRFTAGGEVFAI